MPYDPLNWENDPSTISPLDADNLRHAETQYAEAMADVEADMADPGSGIGGVLLSVIGANPTPTSYTFSSTGALITGTGTGRVYNDTGRSLTITSVRASVGVAPTGASLIVDVNKNGTTIFTTQSARPTIAASTNTATGTPAVTSWPNGQYLTVDVDQVGSTVAGSNLTVTVVAL